MTNQIPQPSTSQPAASNRGKTWAGLTIGLMVLIGLYWLGLAGLQLLVVAFAETDPNQQLMLTLTALWNVMVSVINLWFIRAIQQRRKSVRSGLGFLAVVGTVWGIFSIMQGAWLQIPAVMMYLLVGGLLWVNWNYYTVSDKKKAATSR